VVLPSGPDMSRDNGKLHRVPRKVYEAELTRMQLELARMQYWLRDEDARVVVIFEGRDAAGKGSCIKRIMEPLNPRYARIAALPTPTEREQSQWYFQRYVPHLPAAGEIVVFDRSWYNRAGVERVLGFCTPTQHQLFLRQCPAFERMLIEDGILLTKYWFGVRRGAAEALRGADQGRAQALETLADGPRFAQPLH
jgi:polyphosphate kinase 2 (PPK2 family)